MTDDAYADDSCFAAPPWADTLGPAPCRLRRGHDGAHFWEDSATYLSRAILSELLPAIRRLTRTLEDVEARLRDIPDPIIVHGQVVET
jgi:hypothetical protein